MQEYKVKIITNKAVLTDVKNELTKKSFDDIGSMVLYVKERNIRIVNPEVLPKNFQEQLTTL